MPFLQTWVLKLHQFCNVILPWYVYIRRVAYKINITSGVYVRFRQELLISSSHITYPPFIDISYHEFNNKFVFCHKEPLSARLLELFLPVFANSDLYAYYNVFMDSFIPRNYNQFRALNSPHLQCRRTAVPAAM